MRVAILSRNRSLYSTRRLIEAAEKRDHEVTVIDHLRRFMDISSDNPILHPVDAKS